MEIYKWIKSVMESCYTLKQLDSCQSLINSYYTKTRDMDRFVELRQYKFELMNQLWHQNEEEVRSYQFRGYDTE